MASLEEIRLISKGSWLAWDIIAEPYPKIIDDPCGDCFTHWGYLRSQNIDCCFLRDGLCTVDVNRPRICRTCPFMLDGDNVVDSECEDLGQVIYQQEPPLLYASPWAQMDRREGGRIRKFLQQYQMPSDVFVVIDYEGIRVIDWWNPDGRDRTCLLEASGWWWRA